MFRSFSMLAALACCSVSTLIGFVPAVYGGDLAAVSQPVTTWRPVQQQVIVPVREYRAVRNIWTPVARPFDAWNPNAQRFAWASPAPPPAPAFRYVARTRWEERLQTSYVPVTRNQVTLQPHAGNALPPLVFATPVTSQATMLARGRLPAASSPASQLYDQPQMVAVPAPGAATTRTAQGSTGNSTLVPRASAITR
jgi:hypothetical protein